MKSANKYGFTLIELSIVLVILGLIIGTMAPLFMTMSKKNKLSSGRKIVETARDELKGEFLQTKTLPMTLSTIGHTTDPWQNPLFYIGAPWFAGRNACGWLDAGNSATGLVVCLDGDCTNKQKTNIAFIIGSSGANFNRQTSTLTKVPGIGAAVVRLYSYGTTTDEYFAAPDPTRPEQFDDIVEYVSLNELLQMIDCGITVRNETGHTVCSHGSAFPNGVDITVVDSGQKLSIGASRDNCHTIDKSCQKNYWDLFNADTNNNRRVTLTSLPSTCSIGDI